MHHRHWLARAVAAALATGAVLAPVQALGQEYVNLPGTQPGSFAEATPLDTGGPCGVACHFAREPNTTTAMPYDGWVGSMMGNTMRDPLFLAALTVAEQDAPGVGDYCLRCHTPQGFIAGRTRSSRTASRGTDLEPEDRDGVNCDGCHRMVATTNLGNAQYEYSPTDTRFGPYGDIESIRHPGAVSAWLGDSRMCATCHSITNPAQPLRRADGSDTGQRFPLDTTYGEWSQSVFGAANTSDFRSCQDCHMPRTGMPGMVSTNNTARMRPNPRRHDLAGANAWMLRILGSLRNDMNAGEFYDPELAPFYEAGARRAEAMLRSAVSLELRDPPRSATPGATIQVTARITNLSGHRVPTGYADGRRMWLDVALIDAEGRETVVSGAYDTAQARLTEDPQLKLYETHHGRAGMGYSFHIALNNTIVYDTRLPPRGYRPLPGHEPVGADYSGGENGALRHWDDARYNVTIPATARGTVRVRVRARYQSTVREFIDFLAAENRTDNTGREMQRLYEASNRAPPFDMAEATAQISLGGATTDGGVRDGAVADAATVTPATASGGASCAASPARGVNVGPLGLLAGALGLALARRRRRG